MKYSLLFIVSFISALSGYSQIHVGPSQPYATVAAANKAKAIHAGDTVYIHKGTYSAMVVDSLMGTPSKWITIRQYDNDSVSILGEWLMADMHHVKISGLVFNGNDSTSWANGSIYHQLFFSSNFTCDSTVCNIIVDNCKFMNLLTGPNKYSATPTPANVCLKFAGCDTFQVTNCLFQGCAGSEALSMNADRHGLVQHNVFTPPVPGYGSTWASHCKAGSSLITVQQNTYIGWPEGGMDIGGFSCGTCFCPLKDSAIYEADSINFFSNIIIGGGTCIRLAACTNSNIVNNTCYKSDHYTVRLLQEDSNVLFKNNNISNNIFTIIKSDSSIDKFYINETSGIPYSTFYLNNNLFYGYSDSTLGLIDVLQDVGTNHPAILSGSVFANPLFADTASHNFSLRTGSPAASSGLSISAPVYDFNGNPFSVTSRSIGAIQYSLPAGTQNVLNTFNVNVYPNPSSGIFNLSWSGEGAINSLKIYNMLGQLVFTEIPETYFAKINLSNMPKGIYELVISTNKGGIATRTLDIN